MTECSLRIKSRQCTSRDALIAKLGSSLEEIQDQKSLLIEKITRLAQPACQSFDLLVANKTSPDFTRFYGECSMVVQEVLSSLQEVSRLLEEQCDTSCNEQVPALVSDFESATCVSATSDTVSACNLLIASVSAGHLDAVQPVQPETSTGTLADNINIEAPAPVENSGSSVDAAPNKVTDKIDNCMPRLTDAKSKYLQVLKPLYQKATVSLGDVTEVTNGSVQGYDCLWLQTSPSVVDRIAEQICLGYSSGKFRSLVATPLVGEMLLAKFEVDQFYYRALVQDIDCDENGVESFHVFFLDYGNVERVKLADLLEISDELRETSPQCFLFHLSYVSVAQGRETEAVRWLSEKLEGPLTAILSSHPACPVLFAELQCRNTDVSSELVRLGIGSHESPDEFLERYKKMSEETKSLYQTVKPQLVQTRRCTISTAVEVLPQTEADKSATFGTGPANCPRLSSPQAQELSSPQAQELSAPQAQDLSAPQAQKVSSPQSHELSAPQAQELSVPQAQELSAPQARELSVLQAQELSAPQAQELSSPQAQKSVPQAPELSAPRAQELSAPQTQKLCTPQTASGKISNSSQGAQLTAARETLETASSVQLRDGCQLQSTEVTATAQPINDDQLTNMRLAAGDFNNKEGLTHSTHVTSLRQNENGCSLPAPATSQSAPDEIIWSSGSPLVGSPLVGSPEQNNILLSEKGVQTPECMLSPPQCRSTAVVPPQTLEISDTKTAHRVYISHINTPSDFYINFCAKEVAAQFNDVLDGIDQYYHRLYSTMLRDFTASYVPQVGDYCVAKSQMFGSYFRAEVMEIRQREGELLDKLFVAKNNYRKVKVSFIDYGGSEWVGEDVVFPLMPHFGTVAPMAWHCSLTDVYPVDGCKAEYVGGWDSKAVEAFNSLVKQGDVFNMFITNPRAKMANETLQVILEFRDEKEEFVNERLVDLGVVRSFYLQEDAAGGAEASVGPAGVAADVNFDPGTDDLDNWKPMEEEYLSSSNMYVLDPDDPEVILTGYKSEAAKKARCKEFTDRGRCRRGDSCSYEHIRERGAVTEDRKEVFSTDTTVVLPDEDVYCVVEMTTVMSPSHFYVKFPYGTRSIGELLAAESSDAGSSCGGLSNHGLECEQENLVQLQKRINCHYAAAPNVRKDSVAYAPSEIVVAQCTADDTFYRARIMDSDFDQLRVKVFYVDFGNSEWISHKRIRDITPSYLHLPFQAVECFMEIEPINPDKGWTVEDTRFFNHLTTERYLFCKTLRCNRGANNITVELVYSSMGKDVHVSQAMVNANIAKISTRPVQKFEESVKGEIKLSSYLPG